MFVVVLIPFFFFAVVCFAHWTSYLWGTQVAAAIAVVFVYTGPFSFFYSFLTLISLWGLEEGKEIR